MSGIALDEQFLGSVTVGESGQVVIPAEARERLELDAGDRLLAFRPPGNEMLLLCRLSRAQQIAAFLSEDDSRRVEGQHVTRRMEK